MVTSRCAALFVALCGCVADTAPCTVPQELTEPLPCLPAGCELVDGACEADGVTYEVYQQPTEAEVTGYGPDGGIVSRCVVAVVGKEGGRLGL